VKVKIVCVHIEQMEINCPSALGLVATIEQNNLNVNTLSKEMSGADQGRSYLKSIGIRH
jgi:hypothetical protein